MSLIANQIEERNEVPLGGETLGESVGCEDGNPPQFMNRVRARASQALLSRLMELHMAGYSPEEIAEQVLTTEPENVVFRAAIMIEIILHYAHRAAKERTL
jgi:hypothetical protein